MRCCNASFSVPARARSVLNASSSTLNVSTSGQPWRNASTTGCMATGVAWIRAIRFDMPVSLVSWSDYAVHHNIDVGREPYTRVPRGVTWVNRAAGPAIRVKGHLYCKALLLSIDCVPNSTTAAGQAVHRQHAILEHAILLQWENRRKNAKDYATSPPSPVSCSSSVIEPGWWASLRRTSQSGASPHLVNTRRQSATTQEEKRQRSIMERSQGARRCVSHLCDFSV